MGVQNGTTPMKVNFVISQRITDTVTLLSNNTILGIYSEATVHKVETTFVYSYCDIIYVVYLLFLETTPKFFSTRVVE